LAYIDELAKHLLNVASKADERHESTAEQIAADFFTTEKAPLAISDLQALQENFLALPDELHPVFNNMLMAAIEQGASLTSSDDICRVARILGPIVH
jgi:hypothetical protein